MSDERAMPTGEVGTGAPAAGGRLISLTTMGRPLRLLTALAIAQMIAAAVLVGVRDAGGPSVDVAVQEGFVTVMPAITFWLCVAFTTLAWAYLLSGALHAAVTVRVGAFGVFTVVMWFTLDRASLDGLHRVIAIGLLVCLWGVAAWSLVDDARERAAGRTERDPLWLRLAAALGTIALIAGLFGVAHWGAAEGGAERLFTLGFSLQIALLSVALIPVIFMSAAELVEWGLLAGDRIAPVARRVRTRVAAGATALFALVILADLVRRHDPVPMARQVILGSLVVGFALLLLRRGPTPAPGASPRVPLGAGAAVAIGFVAVYLVSLAVAPSSAPDRDRIAAVGELSRYSRATTPVFSIDQPSAWSVRVLADEPETVFVAFNGTPAGNPAFVNVVGSRVGPGEPRAPTLEELVKATARGADIELGRPVREGPWLRTPISVSLASGRLEGAGWVRRNDDHEWVVYGLGAPVLREVNDRLFEHMVDSWAPTRAEARETASAGSAGGLADDSDRVIAIAAAVWLAIALLLAVAVVRRSRLAETAERHAGAVLVAMAAAAFVFAALIPIWLVVFDTEPGWLGGLRLWGMQGTAAAITLALALGAVISRRPAPLRALIVLNVGFLVLSGMFELFSRSIAIDDRFTIAQAVIVLLALLSDLLMSGDPVTNGHGRAFPRSARVLIYCGYLTLTATAIVYFSSMQKEVGGDQLESLFQDDRWVRLGIQLLAAPLLALIVLLRVREWRAARYS